MNEEKPGMAGHSVDVAINRKGTADHESTTENKTLPALPAPPATWKKIGMIEPFHQGVRITYRDLFGTDHPLYVNRQGIARIRDDRATADVLKIEETITQDLVVSTEGRAYRSRSGRSLCLKLPGLIGGEGFVPWRSFIDVLEGRKTSAPVSIIETAEKTRQNAPSARNSALKQGLVEGF